MAGKLKPLEVTRQIKPGKYPDGDGLYLVVAGPTSRNWSYRYCINSKERWLGLGSLKDVSLAEARLKRDEARLKVKGDRNTAGVDIVQQRREERQQKITAVRTIAPTFRSCAEKYIRDNEGSWKNPKHRQQWPNSLDRYAYPIIGELPIDTIMPSHILEILLPIWSTKSETAHRVRGRIENILGSRADVNDISYRNPAELTIAMRSALHTAKKRAVKSHPALPYPEIASFMTGLADGQESQRER